MVIVAVGAIIVGLALLATDKGNDKRKLINIRDKLPITKVDLDYECFEDVNSHNVKEADLDELRLLRDMISEEEDNVTEVLDDYFDCNGINICEEDLETLKEIQKRLELVGRTVSDEIHRQQAEILRKQADEKLKAELRRHMSVCSERPLWNHYGQCNEMNGCCPYCKRYVVGQKYY